MKEIALTRGQVAIVDDDQYEFLMQWKWFTVTPKKGKTSYAARNLSRLKGKRRLILMHHEIIGKPPKGFEVDHENGQGLDNQHKNLRHVTHRQNQQNQKNRNKSSRYPGVCWFKQTKKWMAKIKINGITEYLGLFTNEEKAFKAYCQAVKKLDEEMLEGAKNIATYAE